MTIGRDSLCQPETAARRARILIGAYRRTDIDDPEVYFTSVVAVLSHFPEQIAVAATDPATGLPSKSKWPPSLAELRTECENLYARHRRAAEQEERVKRQLREREEWEEASRGRVPKSKWDNLRRQVETAADGHKTAGKPKPFTMKLSPGVDPFAGDPLTVSDELRKQMGQFAREIREETAEG